MRSYKYYIIAEIQKIIFTTNSIDNHWHLH